MATFQMNFLSREIGQMTNVSIILPSLAPSDAISSQAYRKGMKHQVLWLLHDYAGDDADYIKFTNIVRFAEASKLAVVMPCDYNKMYTDDPGSSRYFSFIVKELPLLCRAFFSISDKREDHFIGGIGMGAEGAMKAALLFPDNYSVVLNLSNGFCAPEDDTAMAAYRASLHREGQIIARVPDGSPADENDLMVLARRAVAGGKPLPKVIMAWGDQDNLATAKSREGVQRLRDLGFDVQAHEVAGAGRNWDFWDHALQRAVYDWLPLRRSVIYPDCATKQAEVM